MIDRPAFCDFAFGAIVNRSPLVIGISTDGAAPVFGQAIRAKIEALIPKGFARWADAARKRRPRVQALALSFRGRRNFWKPLPSAPSPRPDQAPTNADLELLLEPAGTSDAGSVVLVGAGPGDAELLTLRAVRALQSADVILSINLVSPRFSISRAAKRRKCWSARAGYAPLCKQDDINALMVSLKSRTPRGAAQRWRSDDFRTRRRGDLRVPGRRDRRRGGAGRDRGAGGLKPPQSLADPSRHGAEGAIHHRPRPRRKLPDDIDWTSLADPSVTTVVYMPTRTLPDLVHTALAAGLDPSTPAVAVAQATRPDERTVAAPIAGLPAMLSSENLSGPIVVMIGRVFADQVAAHARGTEPQTGLDAARG